MRPLVVFTAAWLGHAAYATPTSENMTGKKENAMARCPSAVPGAETRVADTVDAVEVFVTASDPIAQAEIRRRATIQVDVALLAERGSIEHTGLGTGSGRFGFCPGLVEQTALRVVDVPGGTKMTIKPFDPSRLGPLQRLTHERARAFQAPHRPAKPLRRRAPTTS